MGNEEIDGVEEEEDSVAQLKEGPRIRQGHTFPLYLEDGEQRQQDDGNLD